jgi:superfamily II DNA or RNA helicase
MTATHLYKFQSDAVEAASAHFTKMRDRKRKDGTDSALLLASPCGTGKTVMLAKFARDNLANSVTIVITPGKGNLASQTHAKLAAELKDTGRPVLLLGEDTPPPQQPVAGTIMVVNYEKVVVRDKATNDYKSKMSRDSETPSFWGMIAYLRGLNIELVVCIDEAHYGSHGSKGRIGEFFNDVSSEYGTMPLRVETTATPDTDKKAHKLKLYPVEVDEQDAIEAGLLRKRIILNHGRDTEESDARKFLSNGPIPSWGDQQDIVLSEMMYRQWHKVYEAVKKSPPNMSYTPLMLFCISNGPKGAEEKAAITTFLASKGITEDNGRLAVHMMDDSLTFEEQQSLTGSNSRVVALIFKQSIATGWDCPRAQFMLLTRQVSKTAKTFTEQLLGRIRRQVYGKSRGVEDLDTAYLYSMCSSIEVTDQSGVMVEDSDVQCSANAEQLEMWKEARVRRTTTVRKGRAGGANPDGTTKNDRIGRKDIQRLLSSVDHDEDATFAGDPKDYVVNVVGEQEVVVGQGIVDGMRMSDAYRDLMKWNLQLALQERFGAAGVKAKGKNAETAVENFIIWCAERFVKLDKNAVVPSLLMDLQLDGDNGITHNLMLDLGRRVMKLEKSKDRNKYFESAYRPYTPATSRYRPAKDTIAYKQGKHLKHYDGKLLETHMYGTPVRSENSESENDFEDKFLNSLANRNGALLSWFRNSKSLDSFGDAFSLSYRSVSNAGHAASQHMFPDYMLLMRHSDGHLVPVAIEVKGTDEKRGIPVDGGPTKAIDEKARRLAVLTANSPSDEYSAEEVGARGDVDVQSVRAGGKKVPKTVYGKGDTIGALVFRKGGSWVVYGQGEEVKLIDWMRTQGLQGV